MSDVTEPIVLDSTGQAIAAHLKGIHDVLSRNAHTVYAFHIDGSESDPEDAVTYMEDAVGMTPAYMDYTNSKFNYGSWAGAFFMPKPCMVLQSGVVDYYLDPDDYTKKADGTASDIADTTYEGNAMIEWGPGNGKKIWYKVVPDAGDDTSATVYISDEQLDPSYKAWSFVNNQGVEVEHFYTPIYNGSVISNTTRSLSGQSVTGSLTAAAEITACKANNKGSDVLWFTEVYADRQLINFLLILMAKSLDFQTAYGRGLDSGSQSALTAYRTGALNDKGLFFGYNDGSHAVKVFGMENWYGAQWRRIAGLMEVSGDIKVKMTYGTQDGSSATEYNTTGSGYISTGITPGGTSGGYISKHSFNAYGMVPKTMSGSSSTFYCDASWFNNNATTYALYGGSSYYGLGCGGFACSLNDTPGTADWHIGAALSFKPAR